VTVFSPAEAASALGMSELELRRHVDAAGDRMPVTRRVRDGSFVGIAAENIPIWRDYFDRKRIEASKRRERAEREWQRAEHEARERGLL
jgi:hypothetical protein